MTLSLPFLGGKICCISIQKILLLRFVCVSFKVFLLNLLSIDFFSHFLYFLLCFTSTTKMILKEKRKLKWEKVRENSIWNLKLHALSFEGFKKKKENKKLVNLKMRDLSNKFFLVFYKLIKKQFSFRFTKKSS